VSSSAARGDVPLANVCHRVPLLRGDARATSHPRRFRGSAWRGPDRLEPRFRAPFQERSPLLEPSRAPPCRACSRVEGRTPSRLWRTHRVSTQRANARASHREGPRFPRYPAKGRRVRRRPRCVPPSCVPCDSRGSLPALAWTGLPVTRHRPPGEVPTLCNCGRADAFSTTPRVPSSTSQAPRRRLNRADERGGACPPSRTARSQRPRRLL